MHLSLLITPSHQELLNNAASLAASREINLTELWLCSDPVELLFTQVDLRYI